MRKALDSFFSFSRPERTGIVFFLSLILSLVLLWRCMQYLVRPDFTEEKQQDLLARWNAVKVREQNNAAPIAYGSAVLFPFDPNTIDSAGILRLGLSPRIAKGWLNWRRHGKKFYEKEDLKPLYNLSAEDYARLEPYIAIHTERPAPYPGFERSRYEPLPASINLNTADSALLVRLNGIGPVLAHKIVERRKLLGGFLNHEQLLEIYRFPDTTFRMLREKLVIDRKEIRLIHLNTAGLEELQRHPYIGEKTARNIVLYRDGLKRFDNMEQLRQVPLMNEEIYRRIAPYFVID